MEPILTVDYRETVARPLPLSSLSSWINFLTSLVSVFKASRTGNSSHGQVIHPTDGERQITIVCISDTHGLHRSLDVPHGDILIHAGDYTLHGRPDHAEDFNNWLGELPHRHKLVVQGNHETNAGWKNNVRKVLSNATVLQNESVVVEGLKIHGTEFFWRMEGGGGNRNPYYDLIAEDTDIVVAHNPAKGYVDKNKGCGVFLTRMLEICPKLVISGHFHSARGALRGKNEELKNTIFINAAVVDDDRSIAKQPVTVML